MRHQLRKQNRHLLPGLKKKRHPSTAPRSLKRRPDDSASLEEWTLDDSDPFAEATAAAHAPTDEWTLDDSDPFADATAAAHAPTDEWTLGGSTSIEDWAVDDSAPVEEEALADIPSISEATAAVKAPTAKAAPAVGKAAKKTITAPTAKPGQNKKKNYLLLGGSAVLILLLCIGAVFFLMQKFNFRITAKDSGLTSRKENAQNIVTPAAVSQKKNRPPPPQKMKIVRLQVVWMSISETCLIKLIRQLPRY